MEYTDNFNPAYDDSDFLSESMDNYKFIEDTKRLDRGYNVIWRMSPRSDGNLKRTKVVVYTTSGGLGSNIRDAETGCYYKSKVGTKDEDLFFKVALATGECKKSKNGSSVLFYTNPSQYKSHQHVQNMDGTCYEWNSKYDARIKEIQSKK